MLWFMKNVPELQQIRDTADRISPHVIRTPTLPNVGDRINSLLPADTELWLKYELLQRTGSFKPRGALNVMMQLTHEQQGQGVTAFSAGNHAIATAYAARILGVSAKVAMPVSANPYRVEQCRSYGADIVFADDMAALLKVVATMQEDEGRFLVHPFEGIHTTEGTATVGLEFCEDAPPLDAVVVPIGGGGLISGVAAAVRQLHPDAEIYGVEPDGACGMRDSVARGQPLARVDINTIADSLSAPIHAEYSFKVIKHCVDDIVTVTDQAMIDMMLLMFGDLKLAVEPAAAAALAAIIGPLKERIAGRRVGVILCGSNIDFKTFQTLTSSA